MLVLSSWEAASYTQQNLHWTSIIFLYFYQEYKFHLLHKKANDYHDSQQQPHPHIHLTPLLAPAKNKQMQTNMQHTSCKQK